MNVGRVEVMDKLKFLHSVMAPVLESYLITACHLAQTVEEMPGESFESIPCLLLIFYLFHMHFFAIGLLNFFFNDDGSLSSVWLRLYDDTICAYSNIARLAFNFI